MPEAIKQINSFLETQVLLWLTLERKDLDWVSGEQFVH